MPSPRRRLDATTRVLRRPWGPSGHGGVGGELLMAVRLIVAIAVSTLAYAALQALGIH